ncbi:hypothetical protein C2S51_032822 [Perilla frutescens var. frutescens]|nr:hypothetical protein C2S51_032822 [Perilla frutescens var. frutescens]
MTATPIDGKGSESLLEFEDNERTKLEVVIEGENGVKSAIEEETEAKIKFLGFDHLGIEDRILQNRQKQDQNKRDCIEAVTFGIQSHLSSAMAENTRLKELQEAQKRLDQVWQAESLKRDAAETRLKEQISSVSKMQEGMMSKLENLSELVTSMQVQIQKDAKGKGHEDSESILGKPPINYMEGGSQSRTYSIVGNRQLIDNQGGQIIVPLAKIDFPKFDGLQPRVWILRCNGYFKMILNLHDDQKIALATMNLKERLPLGISHLVPNQWTLLGPNFKADYMAVSTVIPEWVQNVTTSYAEDVLCKDIKAAKHVDPEAYPKFTLTQGILRYKERVVIGNTQELKAKILTTMHNTPYGRHSELPETSPDGVFQLQPVAVLDRRVVHRRRIPVEQVVVQWERTHYYLQSWEDIKFMKKKFPALDPWGQGSKNGEGIVMTATPIDGKGSESLLEFEDNGRTKLEVVIEGENGDKSAIEEETEAKIKFLGFDHLGIEEY